MKKNHYRVLALLFFVVVLIPVLVFSVKYFKTEPKDVC